MLVLARKKNESITIQVGDEQIRIEILDIERSKCRLGIQAPRRFSIMRDEITQVIQTERLNHEA